jgi:hypothetical protein
MILADHAGKAEYPATDAITGCGGFAARDGQRRKTMNMTILLHTRSA